MMPVVGRPIGGERHKPGARHRSDIPGPRNWRSSAIALLGRGSRYGGDALGPIVTFYVGWKLAGLATGIAGATLVALVAYAVERRRGRLGVGTALGFVIAVVQAVVGFASSSAVDYLVPAVIGKALYGLALAASVIVRRPLISILARETYPFPPEVIASRTFRRVFSRITLVWSGYFLLRSGLGAIVLSLRNVDAFVAFDVAMGVACTTALIAWSMWYGVHGLTHSDELATMWKS